MRPKRTLFLIEVSVFTALALLLDVIPFLSFKIWVQGGSISLAMIPVFILSFRWGVKGGLLSGFLWGILQIAVGTGYVLHPLQGFIDYALAFTVIGLAGVFAKKIQEAIRSGHTKSYLIYISFGVILGSSLRFAAHFVAGAVFFESAVEGQPVWLYSFLYNISYIVPSMIICIIVVCLLFHKQPKILLNTL